MRKKFKDLGAPGFAKGGEVAKELKFMKDKGAPKSMIKAEKKEHGLPAFEGGGSSGGGSAGSAGKSRFVGHGAFNFGKGKAKPFAEGGSIDDDTRSRAMAWVEKRRAQQDAEGAGDASAAEASPAATPARRRAPAAAAAAPKPVVEQKTTTIYSNEGKGKAAPAPAARDTTGFAETIFNAIKPSSSASPGTAQLAQRAARTESAKRIAATKASADEEDANARPEGYKRGTRMRQTGMGPMPFAAGGSIDGCATKGKTRGKVV
jgi:hypothetical protein